MNNAQKLEGRSESRWIGSSFPLDRNGPTSRPFDVFPDAGKAQPIVELLEAVVCRYPERVALTAAGVSITYAELWRAVSGRAEKIAKATAPGDLIGILAPTATTFLAAQMAPISMLACLAAGRPFVAIDPRNPTEWIAQVLNDSRPALLLTANADDRVVGLAEDASSAFDLNETPQQASPNWRSNRLGPDEPACILFTSGSTGQPKGIVNSQRNLLQRVSQSINAAHINCDDRFLTLASMCTIVGVRDMITALLAGASIRLLDAPTTGMREIHRIVCDEQISILFSFPALMRSVLAAGQTRAGNQLRLVRVGGDTTLWSDIALLRKWISPGTFIQSIYAATEAPMMQWFVGQEDSDEERIPIGYSLPGNELAVVDEYGTPTIDGDVGELLVRSPYVALGAWSRGLREASNIQTDANDRSRRILKSGDLVRLRPDGLYDRIGRKDRQVKIRGVRVELDGVEAAIRRHTLVRDVAVIARADSTANPAVSSEPKLVAYVQLHATSEDGLREVETMMRRAVPSQMQPWRYYAMPAIPRLLNSKLDSSVLRSIDLARSQDEAESQAGDTWTEQDPVQILVARIWRDVLNLKLVAGDDDFFALGGNSLGAIAMMVELEKALGRELSPTLINQAPTFAAFCEKLKESGPAFYSPLVILKSGHSLPPLFFFHGVGGSVMELFGIARKMSWSGPVIGVQARGVGGRETPHRTVTAMVDEYLIALQARQPQGPYFLCGYSFGGVLAFEMARRLSDQGSEVAFVGLFDALPPRHHFLRLWTWAAYFYRRVMQRSPSNLSAVALHALAASVLYRPGKYSGELSIFEPEHRDLRLPSSATRWRRHARTMQLHHLQGRHDDMLKGAHTKAAADLLTRCLEAARDSARDFKTC